MKRRQFLGAGAATAISIAWLRGQAFATTAIPAELTARRLDGSTALRRAADIEDLRAGLRGPLLLPGDAGYDDTRRVWNAAFDRHPALIVRCAGAADITRALQFAGAHQLLTAVRGGGHSLSGQSVCEGGLMIDLSLMKSVRVDPKAQRVRVEPGVLLGELDRETLAFGLVTTTGTVSHTGAAGLTLAGGTGRLSRRFGLAIDNVTAFDIVTPDGQVRAADAQQNPDLFWGSRGGGGNFGVVSSFEYRLRAFDAKVYGGQARFAFSDARNLLDLHAHMQETVPDAMWSEMILGRTPSGDRYVDLDVCYSGSSTEGERLMKPLFDSFRPITGGLGPTHYRSLQTHADVRARHGVRRYGKGGYLEKFTPGLFDTMCRLIEEPSPTHLRLTLVPWGGGAVSKVPRTATAFWHRSQRYSINVGSFWEEAAQGEQSLAQARAASRAFEDFTRGFYANSMTDRGQSDMRALYGDNLDRLQALKGRYDPQNLLRMNANVTPSAGAAQQSRRQHNDGAQ